MHHAVEPQIIEGNYLFSRMPFLVFSLLDILLAFFSTLGIVYPLVYGWPSQWPFGITNITAAMLYFILAIIGLIVGLYLLQRCKRRIEEEGSIHISIKNVILVLSPPFFVVSIFLDFTLSLILADFSTPWGYLFFGPGLGLLIARLLYFVYESRYWKLKSIPSRSSSIFRRVSHYVISK